eukprot:GFKZ01010337.1.p1 GENE.GFKZ01010337.1~~GFKZ01010337.1.p1  ORF type:complete len:630 (+),score=50.43 GFKZ01010337.1:191-2080(+)
MTRPPFATHILFASATGTAEDLAHTLAESLIPHLKPQTPSSASPTSPYLTCSPLDRYPLHLLPQHAAQNHLFIFVISTCGDGDVPPNMRQFWRFIRRVDLPPTILASLRFAIFGLGDRTYLKFNAAARKLSRRLSDLSATLVAPLALGDESADGGLDAALWPWWRAVCDILRNHWALPVGVALGEGAQPVRIKESRVAVEVVGRVHGRPRNAWRAAQAGDEIWSGVAAAGDGLAWAGATVVENRVITDSTHLSDEREVRHIVLDVSRSPPSSRLRNYAAGDVIHVLPRNRDSAVDALFELTGWDPLELVRVRSDAARGTRFGVFPVRVGLPCSLWEFVATHMDLSGTPRRKFFEQLAPFATDSRERDKLIEMASIDGAEMLTQYTYREKRTVLMVLRDFPSARPPIEHLIDMVPVLKPRAFSIASSTHAHPGQIHICAAMVQYTTPLRFVRVGVCSAFFRSLREGDTVPVCLEEGSSLRFTQNVPSVLIGPGTGVAPMRSFVSSVSDDGVQRILFFGCRSSKGDFLYKDEWEQFLETGALTSVTTAFSRESETKVYVQHKMLEESDKLWHLISAKGARIYLAGSTGSMPKAVRRTLVEICEVSGAKKAGEAEAFVQKMEAEGRLQMECW